MQQQIDPIVLNVLEAGEQMRWWGYPGPHAQVGGLNWKKLAIQSLVGGVLGAFLLPLCVFYLSHPRPSLPFLAGAFVIGLFLFPLILFARAMQSHSRSLSRTKSMHNALRYTRYAITDRRALIITQWPGQAPGIMAYRPHELAPISRVDQAAGWGDLSFGRRRGRFANIASVSYVEQVLRGLQSRSI
jgi:hypothetical protein